MKPWFFAAFVVYWLSCGSASQNTNTDNSAKKYSVPPDGSNRRGAADTISFIAVGDIMFGSNFPDGSHLPPNDGKYLLKDFDSTLRDADITFGNSEGVFLDAGGEAKGTGAN